MAGLLDFALGFGQGAAGAYAQDRAQQLQMQRQANLERLRAQYAGELKTEQIDEAASLIGEYESGDPEASAAARRRLMAMGVDPTESTQSAASPIGKLYSDRAAALARGDEAAVASIDAVIAQTTQPESDDDRTTSMKDFDRWAGMPEGPEKDAFGRMIGIKDPESDQPILITGDDGRDYLAYPSGDVFALDPEAPGGQRLFRSGGESRERPSRAQEPPSMIAAPEEGGAPEDPVSQQFGVSPAPIDPNTGRFIPPGDYLSMATGPLQALQRGALHTPFVGDVMSILDGDPGSGQTRANQAMRFLQRNTVQLYRYNPERTTNMDVRDAEKLAPSFGAISTTASSREQMRELRRQISNDVALENSIIQRSREQIVPADKLEAARTFVIEGEALLQKIDGILSAQVIQGNRINNKPVSSLTLEDINAITPEEARKLSSEQQQALLYWISYNGWQ